MSEAIVTQIVTFAGALLTGALGGYIAIRVSRDQLKQQTRAIEDQRNIQNMERLHEALSELATTARHLHVAILAKITRGVPIPKESFFEISFERMNMLIDFYVPKLRPDADSVMKGFDELFAAGADVSDGPAVTNGDTLRKRAFHGTKQVDDAVKAAKIKLATLMKNYAIEPRA